MSLEKTRFSKLSAMLERMTSSFPRRVSRLVSSFAVLTLSFFALEASRVRAQSFTVGGSLTGTGDFGTGIFGSGIPGQIGGELRLEKLDLIARGVSLRADLGTQGADAMIFWRADLSQSFNLTLGAGFALLDYVIPGIVARVGLEYRFSAFGVTVEYGWRSSFATETPALRSQWALGFVWFL
jgi:hypothetical protein